MALILSKARRFVASTTAKTAIHAAVAPRLGAVSVGAARPFATVFAEEDKAFHIWNLLEAKKKSKLTFTQIAEQTGLTNAYVAQLFHRQAHLKKETVKKLKAAVPDLTDDDLEVMQEIPFRSYQRDIIRTEPLIYRLEEAMLHYGLAIKAIVNENFGDGIMSAIDVYVNVEKTKGNLGEDRVRITLDGKFLPHIEQATGNMPSPPSSSSSSSSSSTSSSGVKKRSGTTGAAKRKQQPTAALSTLAFSPAAGSAEEVLEAAPTRLVVAGGGQAKRGRGRPAGSKNKAKAQILA